MDRAVEIPEGYRDFAIERVERDGCDLVIHYAGRVFGGVAPELLPPEIVAAIVPGARIIVRYHTTDTGAAGAVAHMLIWHAAGDGWAELYADWE